MKGAPQTDSELPLQGNEKELEEKSNDGFVLDALAHFRSVLRSEKAIAVAPFESQTNTGTFWHLPLYLSKRYLLI